MKSAHAYFFHDIGYFCGTESFLKVAGFCNFPFGDVYEYITDLQYIIQICFAKHLMHYFAE